MPKKLKTKKSAFKRIKFLKNGSLIRRKAYKAHLLRKKSSNQLFRLSSVTKIAEVDKKNFCRMIPYN